MSASSYTAAGLDPARPDDIEKLLMRPAGEDHAWVGFIRGDDHFERVKMNFERVHDLKHIRDRSEDADFPSTPLLKQLYAKQLFEAMVDFTVSPTKTFIDNPDSVQVKRLKMMSNFAFEFLARELVDVVAKVHCGRLGFRPWIRNEECKTDWGYEEYDMFSERFGEVCNACRRSKAFVYSMITSNEACRFASSPKNELGLKEANMRGNKNKAEMLREVSDQRKQGSAKPGKKRVRESDGTDDGGNGGPVAEKGPESV
ncbi:hypothetical protein B0T14DRAFT_567449 [Immersiella caudata]|uniref:Uncharacterized protein n=1 Tax=Immersiella caudata TaxID=314043 RepID=A0AA39WSE0_9PEZI|nr:hypothetical protein B0T14DRAFT_567449 [Immersiella caudata]